MKTFVLKNIVLATSISLTLSLDTMAQSGRRIPESIVKLEADMVSIKGGTFIMGQKDTHYTPHSVTLSNFHIGKYEVTQEQWSAIMGERPSFHKDCPQCPVEMVSYNDCLEFIQRLNVLTGKFYRLPTEAEWEYACRAGTTTTYNTGNELKANQANFANNVGKTTPVGSYKPNAWGLYDMHGNVQEWCMDWYQSDFYKQSPKLNPIGAVKGEHRVMRGGCWNRVIGIVGSASRETGSEGYKFEGLGLRLVRVE